MMKAFGGHLTPPAGEKSRGHVDTRNLVRRRLVAEGEVKGQLGISSWSSLARGHHLVPFGIM